MTRYVLDSSELLANGVYEFRFINEAQAIDWLQQGPWIPRGDPNNHQVWNHVMLLAHRQQMQGVAPVIGLQPGDEALVVRENYQQLAPARGQGHPVPNLDPWEFGILDRRRE